MKYKKGDKFIIEVEGVREYPMYMICQGQLMYESTLDLLEPYDESAAYQRGLNDAWEAARKIVDSRNFTELSSVFDGGNDETGGYTVRTPYYVITNYTAAEAIARIRAYEEQREIHVGDEVTCEGYVGKAVVTYVNDENATILHWLGGASCVKKDHLTKTGRHFPEVAALLNKMKGDADESD